MKDLITFNKPFVTSLDKDFFSKLNRGLTSLSGDGFYTKKVNKWLKNYSKCNKALLTHSCTAALEMSGILMNIKPGDEVIMPSYTFVSTANAIVLRGGTPRFVDIREDTLNIDENYIENAINKKTKAIIPVHYAGVSAEMDTIKKIAKDNRLFVAEDAAQGLMSSYKDKPLGSIGDLGSFSFHETKNIISGEGGALIVNNEEFIERSEIIREKGTNRSTYIKGEIDKYTWCDIGSSYLPAEIVSAFLLNQLSLSERITKERLNIWNNYHSMLLSLEKKGLIKRPKIPSECKHNGHIYFILVEKKKRDKIIQKLFENNIQVTSHYEPLHSSKAGIKYCQISGSMHKTNYCASSIIRLPIWIGLTIEKQTYIVDMLEKTLNTL